VAAAGDVNGDGLGDVIVTGPLSPATAYVVFGKKDRAPVSLLDIGAEQADGFLVTGPPGDSIQRVAGAGDVNGDGLDDIIVGKSTIFAAGDVFVVFGKADRVPVNLDLVLQQGRGLQISGRYQNSLFGTSLAAAGDVNGDGLDDVVACAAVTAASGGIAYVVFGQRESEFIQVSTLDQELGKGFAIRGPSFGAVSGAGDVNGDGLDDVVFSSGGAHVVFGKRDFAAVETTDIAAGLGRGFAVLADESTPSGGATGVGDVNGDGLGDVAVGAPATAPDGTFYVVFGKASPEPALLTSIDAELGGGFLMFGGAGLRVTAAGDINADGLADLLFATRQSTVATSPAAYVRFGRENVGAFDLAQLASENPSG